MAKIEDGVPGATLAAVDAGSKALRVSPRPLDALGHYRFAGTSGVLAGVPAASELFQFRWTDPQAVALVQFVRVRLLQMAAFTAPQELGIELFTATGVTAAGGGGSQLLSGAQSFKKRSSMPQSRVGELRIATTVALGAGTRALSPFPMLTQSGWAGGAGQTIVDSHLDMTSSALEYPLVLHQNESLIVRLGPAGAGAGGSIRFSVEMAWAEMAAASF